MVQSSGKKAPPNNLFAEKIILGHLLLQSRSTSYIFEKLPIDAFYNEVHKILYKTAYSLYLKNKPINFITISDELLVLNLWEITSGEEILFQLSNQDLISEDVDIYISLILDKYLRRNLFNTGSKICKMSYNQSYSIDSLIENIQNMFSAEFESINKSGLLSTSEVLLETLIQLEKKTKEGSYSGITSGFGDLDSLTGGFQKGDLIILAGRPSMGKTALALNFARNISELQSLPVAIFSLEMSREQIIYRLISSESQISSNKLKLGKITRKEWLMINKSISHLANLRIYLDDNVTGSLSEIKLKLMKLKGKTGQIGAIVIDYLQLLTEISYKDTRSQELSKITRNLKIIAKEMNCPVIVLSQLSRNLESRQNKRPVLSDLRESGCLSGDNKLYSINKNKFLSLKSIYKKQTQHLIVSKTLKSLNLVFNSFKKLFITGYKNFFTINIFGGYQIELSSEHKVFTIKGWTKLKFLSEIDYIGIFDKFNFTKSRLTTIIKIKCADAMFCSIYSIHYKNTGISYDLWFPYSKNFICNNIIIHNSIEQDADLVLMLYRNEYYFPAKKITNISELILCKQRNGPVGNLKLTFDPRIVTFSNLIKFS